jgi:hypothetical protein
MTKRTLAAAAALLTLSGGGLAAAAGEGGPLRLGERNPSSDESQALTRETEIIADNGTYGTRQSNKSAAGGGAIYGCRSTGAAGTNPCIRSNNLSRGQAFQFETDGALGGTITAEGGDGAKPFTTNATGVATGLNADEVDGRSADELTKDAVAAANRFASVTAAGVLAGGRGATVAAPAGVGVSTVDFSSAVDGCAQQVTARGDAPRVATAEQVDADTVRVRTFALDGDPAPAPYHLTVSC